MHGLNRERVDPTRDEWAAVFSRAYLLGTNGYISSRIPICDHIGRRDILPLQRISCRLILMNRIQCRRGWLLVRFHLSNIESLSDMRANLNSYISIDVDLSNGERAFPARLHLGGIKNLLHDTVADFVVMAVSLGVHTEVVSVDPSLATRVDG